MAKLCSYIVGVMSLFAAVASVAQVGNLRITEVDPSGDRVEVSNTGPAFTTTAARPFCHKFDYASSIPAQTLFTAGASEVFTVVGLDDSSSDLWLYRSRSFSDADEIVHGLQFGGILEGRTGIAAGVGLWTDANQMAAKPNQGETLAYDGFGISPLDWYIDATPTLGSADSTTPDQIASQLQFPGGVQDFETMSLGDDVTAITGWPVVHTGDGPGLFTIKAVDDVMGVRAPRGSSTQWLRIRDQESADVQNRFYGPQISASHDVNYTWTFYINLEQTPPAGDASKPRFTIQHRDQSFINAWGIELAATGASLVVTADGGAEASVLLYELTADTAVNQWVKLTLSVDFDNKTVAASANDGNSVSLPIDLPAAAQRKFRFCYRGEGSGNVASLLLDDVAVTTVMRGQLFDDHFEAETMLIDSR